MNCAIVTDMQVYKVEMITFGKLIRRLEKKKLMSHFPFTLRHFQLFSFGKKNAQPFQTMCILERAKLFMSSEAPKNTRETVRFSKDVSLNKKEETKPVKQFVQICDIGLIQVEVRGLSSCILAELLSRETV